MEDNSQAMNSQKLHLERIIMGIKEEARLRRNNELMTEFRNQYSEEMEKIKLQKQNEINIFEKRKKELKKELMLLEDCVTNNMKVVVIRIGQKEMERINQKERKQKREKQHTRWTLLELGHNIQKNTETN